jgi:hypothetical protein
MEKDRPQIQTVFKNLFPYEVSEESRKIVTITNNSGQTFRGFLGHDSVFIPIHTKRDEFNGQEVIQIVEENTYAVNVQSGEIRIKKTIAALGLVMNSQTLGLFSDAKNFGVVTGIHLHTNGESPTQEVFLAIMDKAFKEVGLTYTISQSL